jgi:two-component system, NarL family, nitrate/nitrite response regulator NarL
MIILIADDHPLYLSAISEYVVRLYPAATIRFATTLGEALACLRQNDIFDLLLIDYCMPGMEGALGVQSVVALAKGAPVVVMSGVAVAAEVSTCIGAGAKGFFPKTLSGKFFTSALNLVLSGGSYLPAEMFASPAPAVLVEDRATSGHLASASCASWRWWSRGNPTRK